MARGRRLRVLLVEDDVNRHRFIQGWLPEDITLVWCQNGEAALGLLDRAGRTEYAAVMLDRDLDKSVYVQTAKRMSGTDVAARMAERISRQTPVLVHSMSVDREELLATLRANEFPVIQIPFCDLTRENLNAWIAEVREDFEDGE